jgi:hypothetical protein
MSIDPCFDAVRRVDEAVGRSMDVRRIAPPSAAHGMITAR